MDALTGLLGSTPDQLSHLATTDQVLNPHQDPEDTAEQEEEEEATT